jgi:hypothetical protein
MRFAGSRGRRTSTEGRYRVAAEVVERGSPPLWAVLVGVATVGLALGAVATGPATYAGPVPVAPELIAVWSLPLLSLCRRDAGA